MDFETVLLLVLALLIIYTIYQMFSKKKEGLTDILGNVDNMGYTPHFQATFRRQQDMLLDMYP